MVKRKVNVWQESQIAAKALISEIYKGKSEIINNFIYMYLCITLYIFFSIMNLLGKTKGGKNGNI